jgi:hypothetical protein
MRCHNLPIDLDERHRNRDTYETCAAFPIGSPMPDRLQAAQ